MIKIFKYIGQFFLWLLYVRWWCIQDMQRMHAEDRGMKCVGYKHNILWDTYEMDPTSPPQKKEKLIGLRRWMELFVK